LVLLVILSGCTRKYFRTDADREVARILDEKDNFAECELHDYNVYPNPIARYFDPSDPDKPPMPPDDPAAWLLSPHPQKPKQIAWYEGTGYLGLLEQWNHENRARLEEQKGARGPAQVRLGRPYSAALAALLNGVRQVSLGKPFAMSDDVRTADYVESVVEPVKTVPAKKSGGKRLSKNNQDPLAPPRELPGQLLPRSKWKPQEP